MTSVWSLSAIACCKVWVRKAREGPKLSTSNNKRYAPKRMHSTTRMICLTLSVTLYYLSYQYDINSGCTPLSWCKDSANRVQYKTSLLVFMAEVQPILSKDSANRVQYKTRMSSQLRQENDCSCRPWDDISPLSTTLSSSHRCCLSSHRS